MDQAQIDNTKHQQEPSVSKASDPAPLAALRGPAPLGLEPYQYEPCSRRLPFLALGEGFDVEFAYDVRVRRVSANAKATITCRLSSNLTRCPEVSLSYLLPKSFHIGGELPRVEKALYRFVSKIVSAEMQRRMLLSDSEKLKTMQWLTATSEAVPYFPNVSQGQPSGITKEQIEQVLIAVRQITGVTSLSYAGLLQWETSAEASPAKPHATGEVLTEQECLEGHGQPVQDADLAGVSRHLLAETGKSLKRGMFFIFDSIITENLPQDFKPSIYRARGQLESDKELRALGSLLVSGIGYMALLQYLSPVNTTISPAINALFYGSMCLAVAQGEMIGRLMLHMKRPHNTTPGNLVLELASWPFRIGYLGFKAAKKALHGLLNRAIEARDSENAGL